MGKILEETSTALFPSFFSIFPFLIDHRRYYLMKLPSLLLSMAFSWYCFEMA